MKCLNIIIFYENREEVENYICEVASISNGLVDIMLVVNKDECSHVTEMDIDLRAKGIDCFQIIDYGTNVGYLNAMLKTVQNVAIDEYDYIILSNTDIHYETRNFFQELCSKKYPSGIGCIAPSVFATQNNSYSNPHYMKRIPKAKLERLVKIFKYPTLGKCYLWFAGLKAKKTKTRKQSSCFVYSPHGCYMIFTKIFIKKILGYEYGVILYSEESVVGELLLRNSMKCYYDDSLSVLHRASSVTGRINYEKRFKVWRESLEYILKEFY